MEKDLVYKYSYGDIDLLGALIKIYKIGYTDEYIVEAEFTSFEMNVQPTYYTTHTVVSYDKEESVDDEQLTTIKHKLNIIAHLNPPPETIVKFIRK